MDDIISSPPSPNPHKRLAQDEPSPSSRPLNLKGTQFIMPTPPETEESSNASPQNGDDCERAASPAPSSSALSSIQEVLSYHEPSADKTDNGLFSAQASTSKSGQPPAKRRKISPSEKAEQQRAKDAKAAEKADQKARKDEEKRLRDEEKRKKAEEKEQKKREKELEEERKYQAKLKKERSQMRLANFFQKPATPAKTPAPNDEAEGSASHVRRRSLSLELYDSVAEKIRPASPIKGTPLQATANVTPLKPIISDYRKYFLPFEIQSHTILAPTSQRGSEDQERAQEAFDSEICNPSLQEKYDLGTLQCYASIKNIFSEYAQTTRGVQVPSARQVVEQIHGYSSNQPIDLTSDTSMGNPLSTLQEIPYRYLHFHEDVRPPYFGSYSKHRSPRSSRRMSRNPFVRERKDTDYDYDSEAEWEEPEEGEDLGNDEDDEAESTGDADEMDGFLDDEDDMLKNKRKFITGDLVPVSTGLCWADETGRVLPSTEHQDGTNEMKGMRLGFLIPGFTGKTINPFSTAYWEAELMPPPGVPVKEDLGLGQLSARPPLKERHNSATSNVMDLVGASQGEKGPINSVAATHGEKRGRKPAPKTLSKEDLDEFKDAVVGSGLGKLDLCKGLKARFPKIPNDVIKDTLGSHFAQIGTKREEKKWVFIGVS